MGLYDNYSLSGGHAAAARDRHGELVTLAREIRDAALERLAFGGTGGVSADRLVDRSRGVCDGVRSSAQIPSAISQRLMSEFRKNKTLAGRSARRRMK